MALQNGMHMFIAGTLSVIACILGSTAAANEQDSVETKIARAESAAPATISTGATIMDVDGTILREGSNGWTCLPGVPLIPGDDHPMCNDATWMRFIDMIKAGEPFSTDVVGFSYMLQGDAMVNNDDPGATDPNDGGPWVQEGPHIMLLTPSPDLIDGVSRDPFSGGPYVMWDNTPAVHVMVPVVAGAE